MRTARSSLRLALILDVSQTPLWVHSLIEQLRAAPHLEVVAIVFAGQPRASRSLPLLLRLWLLLEKWYLGEAASPWLPETKTYPVETIHLAPSLGNGGAANRSDLPLTRMRSLELDVLVQLGSSELPPAIFGCARCGVWTICYRGYPRTDPERALLSAMYYGRRMCELVLRSTSAARRSHVLYRSSIDTHAVSLYRNVTLDQQRRSQILLRRLSDLFDRGWNNIVVDEDEPEVADKVRVQSTGVLFLARLFTRCVRYALSKLWFEEQWIIALSGERDPITTPQRALPNPMTVVTPQPGQNHADPFLFARDGKTYMFFEHWQSGNRGSIHCAELGPDGVPTEPRQVLACEYHLSYPFVFQWRGEIYMVPETQQNKTVEVYRATGFPWHWQRAAVLLTNVAAADPTILEYRGKLWLFVAGLSGAALNTSELSLFFCDSLFGKWHPHPGNPIVCDIRRARPAGALFTQSGMLIRPGQDCSIRYGRAITLNRVEMLSETDYREVPIATILPNWMPGICATHTLNRSTGIQVLDAVARRPRYASLFRHFSAA